MSTRRTSSNRATEVARLRERRSEQLTQVRNIIPVLEERIQQGRQNRRQLRLLDSVSLGLYEEIDKLCKKAPAEYITDLVLQQVNDVIRETKELLHDDVYIQRLNEFVPAGDNPEHRDVVIVLRQIRQGLKRFEVTSDPQEDQLVRQLNATKVFEIALQLYLEGTTTVTESEFKEYGVSVPNYWLMGYDPKHFMVLPSVKTIFRQN